MLRLCPLSLWTSKLCYASVPCPSGPVSSAKTGTSMCIAQAWNVPSMSSKAWDVPFLGNAQHPKH